MRRAVQAWYAFLLFTLFFLPGNTEEAYGRDADRHGLAALLDSLAADVFFEDGSRSDWKDQGRNGFHPAFIPQFDDETYAARIAEINRRTPFRLTYNEHVRSFIRIYAVDKRMMTSRIIGLARTYFPYIEQKLREYDIPEEMKYLAIVESALNPVAVSHANAKGLWQFIYGTGKMYDLQSTAFIEDRFDPYKATVAACEHMRDLYDIYGDWFLVLAAYNSGAGNVNKAIRRSGGRRDYWEIWSWLPRETRGYVPAFIAVTYVMNYYREHNISPTEPDFLHEDIVSVEVDDVLAFDQVHEVLGVPMEDLQFLNPQYKRGIIPAAGTRPYVLRLPEPYRDDFLRRTDELYAYRSSTGVDRQQLLATVRDGGRERRTHIVRRGESLGSIARMYRCYVSQLVEWNNLRSSRIYPGQKLAVFGAPETIRRASSKPSRSSALTHVVRRGENLGVIADRYRVTVDQIASWNKLSRKRLIYPGQKLKIYSGSTTHTVRRGETLSGIAERYGMRVSTLASINQLGRKQTIYPGQKLSISGSGEAAAPRSRKASAVTHVVRRGENLGVIAKRYRVTVSQIAGWNDLGSKRLIYPGQKLRIYGGSTASRPVTHTVRRGETLGEIADRYGVSVSSLAQANDIGRRRTIYPGQKLTLAGGSSMHTVKRGENLIGIAKRYGVRVSDIVEWNNIGRRQTIYPGQKIRILSR
ncbi:LysM peptidoglycan-binding domain-containing protein [Prosthecochloris sp. N3]|uniref:LysM peptidoglycan-binding domain-containing protein n=1 Tax=Prosthecochloris ethylica TaxID=2743976 RepID=A0ABR9XS99_9CHLB|nr:MULTISPECIES: LysM peptidoglycan-binding domain-containing protein [Prosthecochloris]MBF0585380.1 LysM peptidoglycan-binding domain-containing protein [Prosthecochloris ethylica]MBF0636916.1 LysM peptidoglycan-binding domain-containing protein [Prosthecochloris ethylica]NUK46609.1 LysM peptidoglycan-binding domain-containing protein [Prosthecochloris ethylica]RNA64777.1 LysM peptidoglycan-binding domain-containing protein [Prosthecochloris sp. ZM_2]